MQQMDEAYYSELHATQRDYDSKLWQIPVLYLAALAFTVDNIFFKDILNIKNLPTYFISTLVFWILILLYNKAHVFHISIAKKINEFDVIYNENAVIKRMPLTTMTSSELDARIKELNENKAGSTGAEIKGMKAFLAKRTVSFWVLNSMVLFFIISFTLLVTSLTSLFIIGLCSV